MYHNVQIVAADKQLRSTRAFLEEQATEREQERDEFNKELSRLQEQLRDRDKDWTTKERFANEVSANTRYLLTLGLLFTITSTHCKPCMAKCTHTVGSTVYLCKNHAITEY